MIPRLRLHPATLVALVLSALHAWMAASVSPVFSATVDESVHLTAGYAYWTTGDYRLQPENGNLAQRWLALPLLSRPVGFPPTTSDTWNRADIWHLGQLFLHESGNDGAAMLASARAMVALLSGGLCFLVFHWARSLFGAAGGLVAVVLTTFSPTLLAHGGLATSDTAAALGFALATLTWWRLLHGVTVVRLLGAAAAFALLALSKYSVVLFVPVAGLMAGLRLGRPAALPVRMPGIRRRVSRWQRIVPVLGSAAFIAVLCVGAIWAAYGFRFAAAAPAGSVAARFIQPWEVVLFEQPSREPMKMADDRPVEATDLRPGLVQHAVRWMHDHRVLPEAYLYGLAFVEKNARGRLAFFAGEYRMTGWREFFPTAFLLKSTVPELTLMFLGLVGVASASARRRAALFYRLAPLFCLLVVYWGFAVSSRLNIGHRHLLPVYPAHFILAGGTVLIVGRSRLRAALVGLLLAGHAWESVAIRPDYLAYFNPLAGGSAEAHRLFVDSSLDWGQDLPRLRRWLDRNAGHQPVYLSYFGGGDPAREGIYATRFGDGYFDWAARTTPPRLTGGIYCISATMFRRVYTLVRGPWTDDYENAYQTLRAWRRHMSGQSRQAAPTDVDGSPLQPDEVQSRLFRYEQLQFGRFCHFLRWHQPDARVGYSILVFKLTDAEVNLALDAPLPRLNAALSGQ